MTAPADPCYPCNYDAVTIVHTCEQYSGLTQPDVEHAAMVDRRRADLRDALAVILASAATARRAVDVLASNEVYDVEVVETDADRLIRAALDTIVVATRGAQQIAPEVVNQ